jgi:hypothetical protein
VQLVEDLNKIYGIFVFLALCYHNISLQIEVFETTRNVYDMIVYKIMFNREKVEFVWWAIFDGGKVIMYFFTVSAFVESYIRLKIGMWKFADALPPGKLRQSVKMYYVFLS